MKLIIGAGKPVVPEASALVLHGLQRVLLRAVKGTELETSGCHPCLSLHVRKNPATRLPPHGVRPHALPPTCASAQLP